MQKAAAWDFTVQDGQTIDFSLPPTCTCICWHVKQDAEDPDFDQVTTEKHRAGETPAVGALTWSYSKKRRLKQETSFTEQFQCQAGESDHEKHHNQVDVKTAAVKEQTLLCRQRATPHTHISGCDACLCTWSWREGGETQVITLPPPPSSLCNRSLPLPKNRQSAGCTSSSSLTALPLQTIPFVKLFQGEPSPQILHSAPSAGSEKISPCVHGLGDEEMQDEQLWSCTESFGEFYWLKYVPQQQSAEKCFGFLFLELYLKW